MHEGSPVGEARVQPVQRRRHLVIDNLDSDFLHVMIGGGEGICGTAGRGRSLIVRGGLVSAVSELPGLTHKEALTHPLGIIVVHPRVCGEHAS